LEVQGGSKLDESGTKVREAAGAEISFPLSFKLRHRLADGSNRRFTSLGEVNGARAPVGRIATSLDIPLPFELADQVVDRLTARPGAARQRRDSHPARRGPLENREVGGPDPLEPAAPKVLLDPVSHRPPAGAKQRPDEGAFDLLT
jgi:hypothetical protein